MPPAMRRMIIWARGERLREARRKSLRNEREARLRDMWLMEWNVVIRGNFGALAAVASEGGRGRGAEEKWSSSFFSFFRFFVFYCRRRI